MVSYAQVAASFVGSGMVVRGGFAFEPDESPLDALNGRAALFAVLVGNVGPELWAKFGDKSDERPARVDALDRWTVATVAPMAEALGARAVYPFDKPFLPFQNWAMRAEPVMPSPLGILIHPEYGLWHAYRAALLFSNVIDVPLKGECAGPCETCSDRPCLSTCPVAAFGSAGYDVPRCMAHLKSPAGASCLSDGCLARAACPVGVSYHPEQARFHMRAFFRARLAAE